MADKKVCMSCHQVRTTVVDHDGFSLRSYDYGVCRPCYRWLQNSYSRAEILSAATELRKKQDVFRAELDAAKVRATEPKQSQKE